MARPPPLLRRSADSDIAAGDDAEDEDDEEVDEEQEEEEEAGEAEAEDGGDIVCDDEAVATRRGDAKYSANDFVQWTGFKKKLPLLIFCPDAAQRRIPEVRQLGEKYHMAYKLCMHECKLVRNILAGHGFRETHPNASDYNLMWTGSHVKPFVLRSMLEHQKINHFPRSYELTRKDRLYKNVQRMQQLKGFKHFDFVPTTFVLPTEFNDFTNAFLRDKGTWIVKPVASSRGRGIFLVNHPDQVPADETFVVCRYVQKPFLIDGFKFDLRLYVAVTSFDPLLIYLFEEGLARFATVRFDKSQRNIQNQCMHLTNYSVNKKNDDFVRNEDPNVEDYGNKWSLGALLRCLREEGHDATAVMMRIEDVIIKTILSAEAPIATACKMFMPYRGNCFEIFGFDILLDSNLRPWVLEVNLSPSLNCDSPLDLKIKGHMVCDLLSLSGVILHDPCTRMMSANGNRARAQSASLGGSSDSFGKQQHLQRPRSACNRPSSASRLRGGGGAVAADGGGFAGAPTALTTEEVKLIKRVKEEHARRGGWIRIFPTPYTWDLYSDFLQFTTSSNLLLHEHLFGERSDTVSQSKRQNGMLSLATKLRSFHIHDMPAHAFLSGNNQIYERLYVAALQRSSLYERKLGEEPVPVKKLRSQATYIGAVAAEPSTLISHQPLQQQRGVPATAVSAITAVHVGELQQFKSRSSSRGQGQIVGLGDLPPRQQQQLSRGSAPLECLAALPENAGQRKELADADGAHNRAARRQTQHPAQAPTLAQGVVAEANGGHREVASAGRPQALDATAASTPALSTSSQPLEQSVAASSSIGNRADISHPSQTVASRRAPSTAAVHVETWDAVKQLQSGVLMSKMQARRAFATYLTRVQHRLLAADDDSCSAADADGASGDESVDEQTDLVLRFLKRAAANLSQPFKVVVPSRRLPMSVRRRILAKQLGDFVHLYSKETDVLKVTESYGRTRGGGGGGTNIAAEPPSGQQQCTYLDENKFETFVSFADEAELELLLTAYTKINKSASTFLGRSGVAVDQSVRGQNGVAESRPPASRGNPNQPLVSLLDGGVHADAAVEAGPAITDDDAIVSLGPGAEEKGGKDRHRRASDAAAEPRAVNKTDVISSTPARSQSHIDVSRVAAAAATSEHAHTAKPLQATGVMSSYADAVHIYSTRLHRPASAAGSGRPRSASSGPGTRGRLSRPSSARLVSSEYSSAAGLSATQPAAIITNENGFSGSLSEYAETVGGPRSTTVRTAAFGEIRPEDVSATLRTLRLRQKERNYRTTNVAGNGADVDLSPPSSTSSHYRQASLRVAQEHAVSMATEGDLMAAYSAVTGVRPSAAFVPSRHSSQYEMLMNADDPADRQMQMIAASRALLEASKAMHQEMVAQAHAATKKLRDASTSSAIGSAIGATATADSAASAPAPANGTTLAPRPPAAPRSTATASGATGARRPPPAGAARRRHQHRTSAADAVIASVAAEHDGSAALNSEAFYSSLKYDALTGQSRAAVK